MRLHSLTQTHSKKKADRVGRGISAGQGKTSGRGTKGQKARTGANSNIPRTFDGGATSMIERLPKLKGFKSMRTKPKTISLFSIAARYQDKEEVTMTNLLEKGLIESLDLKIGVKIVSTSKAISTTYSFDTSDSRLKVSSSLKNK